MDVQHLSSGDTAAASVAGVFPGALGMMKAEGFVGGISRKVCDFMLV